MCPTQPPPSARQLGRVTAAVAALLTSFGVVASVPTLAQESPATHESAQLARIPSSPSAESIEALEQRVVSHTLSNGLRIILYRRGVAPVFAGAVTVHVGGVDEHPGATGISHMLEHMAFKGTPEIGTNDYEREQVLLTEQEQIIAQSEDGSVPAHLMQRWEEIEQELKSIWASETFTREYEKRGGSGMNATTAKELTNYFVDLPISEFEFWAEMESARILRPVMRQFYRERDVVLEERRMRFENDPGGKLYETLLGVAFLQHPYRYPVIGYEHDLRRLTASQTEAFHRRYYVPSNMVVSVVGDIDPHQAIPVLERTFGRIPPGEAPKKPTMLEPEQQGERELVVHEDASPRLMVAYRKAQYPHPDDPAISLMAEILAGSTVSPLYRELVTKRQLATSVRYGEGPGSQYPNLLMFSLSPKHPHGNREVLRAFDELVIRFVRVGPSDEELEIARRALAVQYLDTMRSNRSLALVLNSSELLYGDWRTLIDWYEKMMQVRREDVHRVAKQYLVRSARTVAMLERDS